MSLFTENLWKKSSLIYIYLKYDIINIIQIIL